MSIRRHGQIWNADYYADGRRIQESTGTTNRREAEKFMAFRASDVQRGVFVKPVNIYIAGAGRALHRPCQAAQAIMAALRADARQSAGILRLGEIAGHHTG